MLVLARRRVPHDVLGKRNFGLDLPNRGKFFMDVDASPAFKTKFHHPYFTPHEVEALSTKQRGKLSTSQEEKQRQQACSFIEAVGGRIGL